VTERLRTWLVRQGVRQGLVAALLTVVVLPGCGMYGGGDGGGDATVPPEPRVTPRTGPAETRNAVPYAQKSPKQTLDLYLPAGDGQTVYPMVVLIHGGGFFSGDSSGLADRAKLLASKGFAAASIDYRLSDEASFPAGVQDAKAAIRYLRANARSWGVDPHRIGVWGESAGGYLASMLGATDGQPRFEDDGLGNAGVSPQVQAVVSWFAPSDFATMDQQAREAGCDASAQTHGQAGSPESRWLGAALPTVPGRVAEASVVAAVGSARSLPPFFLVHGEKDCTVALGQSVQLEDALRKRQAQVTLTVVPWAGHADQKIVEQQTRASIEFLRSALGVTHPGA
jgi:acetyl esterase/lipase